jgi:TRAP-type uncharacterized transport system fused permease subunit
MMGWLVKKLNPWERVVLVAAALLLIKPGLYTDAAGYILLAAIYIRQKYFLKDRPSMGTAEPT